MADTPDLSKIIGLIMENPDLIARIQGLAKGEAAASADEAKEPPSIQEPTIATQTSTATEPKEEKVVATSSDYYGPREKRSKLLYAMKPYLSTERAKAIDSMLSVAEILDMMRSK